ncbi:MAG TPA: hypothetical protein VLZ76_06125 [Lysobacter sp.]|jgi:type II secretory pathway pseudopilin PulG|nr:hypothetical protein [Lysobacter sp.]
MTTPSRRHAGGWSLVELAVVLAVTGVLGLALWQVLPLAPKLAADEAAMRDLARAEQALLGYALAHHRLPAPKQEGGLDMLPVQQLGLPTQMKLRYQIQTQLTASPGDSFRPLLPPDLLLPGTPPIQINGLDLCMRLKLASSQTLSGMEGVPTSFALMHAGPAGHDQTAGAAFALPGTPDLGMRKVLAVGPGELAARLACPDRVARTRAAVSAAYTAYDLARVAKEYKDFRVFAIQVAEMNEDNARVGRLFAIFDITWGVALEVIAILQEAAGWPPDGIAIATGIASHVQATAELAVAILNMVEAETGLEDAKEATAEAKRQRDAANVNLARMQALARSSREQAIQLDQKGLQP